MVLLEFYKLDALNKIVCINLVHNLYTITLSYNLNVVKMIMSISIKKFKI